MTVYRVSCSIAAVPAAVPWLRKRTAPVGCVGWRFHHDSLGSHASLHLYGPQKTQSCSKGTRQAWQLQIALRGRLEQLNLPWNKCKEEEEEGQVVTISTIELLNTDSDFTFFHSGVASPVMSTMWRTYRTVHVAGWLKRERNYPWAFKCYFRHLRWLDRRFRRHVEDLAGPTSGNGGSRICFLIWLRLENIK